MFLTNFPARGWLAYDALRDRREDLVMVALTGNPDGTSEVDYTVNPATGFPWATGPRNLAEPLNSVLPAWDVAMGGLAATGLLAAERHRTRTGEGQLIRLALSDVAFAMVGHLGRIAEAQLGGQDPRSATATTSTAPSAHDFATSDGRRVMVVALTGRQWTALLEVTGTAEAFRSMESVTGHDLDTEAGRFEARDFIAAVLRPWFAARYARRDPRGLRRHRRLLGPVPDVQPARATRTRAAPTENPMFSEARAARRRLLPDARLTAGAHRGRAHAGRARAAARRAHRGDPRRRARAQLRRDRAAVRRGGGGRALRAQAWRPHSDLPVPDQRPSRPAPGTVQCVQPIVG